MGAWVGLGVKGDFVGLAVLGGVGLDVGFFVGAGEGASVGLLVTGAEVGTDVGFFVGTFAGAAVGPEVTSHVPQAALHASEAFVPSALPQLQRLSGFNAT